MKFDGFPEFFVLNGDFLLKICLGSRHWLLVGFFAKLFKFMFLHFFGGLLLLQFYNISGLEIEFCYLLKYFVAFVVTHIHQSFYLTFTFTLIA